MRPGQLMTLVDFLDDELLDVVTTHIPASSASRLVVVASLMSDVRRILVNDTTGNYIGLYQRKKNEATFDLKAIVGLEQNQQYMDVMLSQGAEISIRHMKDLTILGGELCIQFFG